MSSSVQESLPPDRHTITLSPSSIMLKSAIARPTWWRRRLARRVASCSRLRGSAGRAFMTCGAAGANPRFYPFHGTTTVTRAALNSAHDFRRSRRAGTPADRIARGTPRPGCGDRTHVVGFALRPVAAHAPEEAQAEIEGHDFVFRKQADPGSGCLKTGKTGVRVHFRTLPSRLAHYLARKCTLTPVFLTAPDGSRSHHPPGHTRRP